MKTHTGGDSTTSIKAKSESRAAGGDMASASNFRLLVCVGGVFFCYFVYGLLQEKITRGTFGETKERFTYSQCLVFLQCVVNAIFAKVSQLNKPLNHSCFPIKSILSNAGFCLVGCSVSEKKVKPSITINNDGSLKVMLELTDSGSRDTTSEVKYALCACSYLGAMVSSNTALQYVNYPTQVLGKSCKPIPVMLLGRFTENLALDL